MNSANNINIVSDFTSVDRRLQRLLPRRSCKDGLAIDGRAQETIPDLVASYVNEKALSSVALMCIMSLWFVRNYSNTNIIDNMYYNY